MKLRSALLAACLLTAVAACSSADDAPASADVDAASTDTSLAGLMAEDANLSSAAQALAGAGLTQAMDAEPAYTVLAPTNAAFSAFNQAGDDADGGGEDGGRADGDAVDRSTALAAVMRGHILPGYLTRQDIANALASGSGSVTMKTMAGDSVTFSQEGDGIRVTAADGSTALLDGNGTSGSNGVILPVDTVLKTL